MRHKLEPLEQIRPVRREKHFDQQADSVLLARRSEVHSRQGAAEAYGGRYVEALDGVLECVFVVEDFERFGPDLFAGLEEAAAEVVARACDEDGCLWAGGGRGGRCDF